MIALVFAGVLAWMTFVRLRAASRRRILSEYITNNMPSGVVTVDSRGRITGHNPASQRIFGYELSTGRALSDLVDESARMRPMLARCMTTGQAFTRQEFNVRDAAGPRRHIGVSLSPITDSSGKLDGAVCILSDLTEIVKLQEQIRLKENFVALGEMSAGIAHEFKNALTTISGYAQMLRDETDPKSVRSYAQEIEQETRSLAKIIDDFLNFARPASVSMQEIDPASLVSTALADLRDRVGREYTLDQSLEEGLRVSADPTLLRQAILNLLINAVESFDENGRIEVSLADTGEGAARIEISDNGLGIDSEDRAKLFIPFYTTKESGTGLGLPLVQKILLAHNASIEIESREDRGTRVVVTIPLAGKPA